MKKEHDESKPLSGRKPGPGWKKENHFLPPSSWKKEKVWAGESNAFSTGGKN